MIIIFENECMYKAIKFSPGEKRQIRLYNHDKQNHEDYSVQLMTKEESLKLARAITAFYDE